MTVTRHLLITGRVQGVGFRFFVERKARALGLCGWVRNRHDGSVEAVVQGAPEAVEAMVAAVRRGPPGAAVSGVRESEAEGEFSGFEIRPSA
ncbi:MAG TPA: acylphosphatase [Burkholderiales bacterium]|nr:acylphosphatase [Burkholderiales bacterium]